MREYQSFIQDQQLVPFFDVTRNAFLGSEIRGKGGKLNFKKMKELVDEKLKLIESDFTSDQQISSLSVGQREQVAIVTALLQNPKLLILDEPTASLSSREIEKLFEVIGKLKKEGVTVIYISHHLDEIFRDYRQHNRAAGQPHAGDIFDRKHLPQGCGEPVIR